MNSIGAMFLSLTILSALALWPANASQRGGSTDVSRGKIPPTRTFPRSIVNGYNADNMPFYVRLSIGGSFCGGTLIASRRAATAAHCIHGESSNGFIEVGDFSNSRSQKIKVTVRGYMYSNYDDNTLAYDVAILELSKSVSDFRILPICSRDYYRKLPVYVVGMGLTSGHNSNSFPYVLQEVELRETRSCPYDFNVDRQICAEGNNRDSCGGDSGGPLFTKDNDGNAMCLYGIVSFGSATCDGAGIYTRASYFANWLLN